MVANNSEKSNITFDFSKFPCRVIYIYENLMYPAAINIGANEANGHNLIFCDADTCVTPKWLSNLVKQLDVPNVGYVSAKLLDMQSRQIWEFGTACSGYNFPHPFKNRPINFKLCNNNHIVWGACAACSAIKRDVFYNVGKFDEKLVCSYSDLDLAIRLRETYKLETMCVTDSIAFHQGSSTFGSGMSSGLKEDTKGVFCAKHPNISCNIEKYFEQASKYFTELYTINNKNYFCVNLSSIANPELYFDYFKSFLHLKVVGEYEKPITPRDIKHIDLINTVHHSIRSYKLPLLYFVDSFNALEGNALWKEIRSSFQDIVLDRHANIELLSKIRY
ncbi:MAG: glycosyltransferase family 2 protein [Clostridia bacterium]|nr:glycosyltransferase family 2 protein [Clostridia bacterium]